jgi:hypothetical protein
VLTDLRQRSSGQLELFCLHRQMFHTQGLLSKMAQPSLRPDMSEYCDCACVV